MLKKMFLGLFGVSVFSAGAGWAFVLLTSSVDDGTGGLATKGFFVPLAIFMAACGIWLIGLALKSDRKISS